VQTGLTIALAATGFGPFSLVLPRLINALLTVIACWWMAFPPLRLKLQAHRWRFLISDGALAMGAYACDLAVIYGSYLILSISDGPTGVGLYYFAFNLSLQTIVLVTMSLGGVLFPALSKLGDEPFRQARAFLRAIRLLACIAVPACFLQAALADPGIRLLFHERWEASIPLVQILSMGMVLRAIARPAGSLMQAQGRFAAQFRVALASVGLFAVLGTIGAAQYGPLGVAVAVALHMLIIEPLNLYVALAGAGLGWRDIGTALAAPLALGAAVIAPAFAAGALMPHVDWVNLGRCVIILLVAAALYFPVFRWIVPDAWGEGVIRLRAVLGR
jgi:PST family polysaccharide transporter